MSVNKQLHKLGPVKIPRDAFDKFCAFARASSQSLDHLAIHAITDYLEKGAERLPYMGDQPQVEFSARLPHRLYHRVLRETRHMPVVEEVLEGAIRFMAKTLPEVVPVIEPPHTPKIDITALAARMIGFRRRTPDQGTQPLA